MTNARSQAAIDADNARFWDELCGSGLGAQLGLTGRDARTLALYDQAYFDIYPYLLDMVKPFRMRGKRVLEIGLGYGTLGQVLFENAGDYTGLDIAAGPVAMMQERLRQRGRSGRVLVGSAHAIPEPDASFDFVVSIGCFHHTGDVGRCIDESFRVLKPGGALIGMVYAKYSYRRVRDFPVRSLREFLQSLLHNDARPQGAAPSPHDYDSNLQGQIAPETAYLSERQLRGLLSQFTDVQVRRQNVEEIGIKGRRLMTRATALRLVGPAAGSDHYWEAQRPA